MALKLYDKIVPSGEFALIDAANVEMPDGRRLTEVEFGGGSGAQGPQGPQGIQGEQGPQGATGEDGYTPVKGTDYWTEEDKAEIVFDVLAQIPDGGGSGGISTSAARLLITILSSATFVNDQSANIQRLNELLLAGTDEPEIPDEPDFTSSELGIAVLGEMILGGDDQENDSEDSGDNTTADDGGTAVLGAALLGEMIIGAGG